MNRPLVALLCALASASSAAAQTAPLFVEPGHWSYDVVRRLSAAGLAPLNSDPAEAPLTTRHVRRVLEEAAARSDSLGGTGLGQLARGWLARLDAEADSSGVVAALRVRAGWMASRGEARGGEGFFVGEDWVGAQPIGRTNGPAAAVVAGGYVGRRLSWQAEAGRLADEWVVPAAAVSASLGPFDVWGGRRRLHYGAGRGGALVLGSGINEPPDFAPRIYDTFDGIGIHVREPFDFPGFLRVLGPARIEVVAGRLPYNGRAEEPFVVFGRLTGMPFGDRFMLGVNRGSIFGGMEQGFTLRRLAGMLVGANSGEFENQIISAVMRYRPPLGPVPLEVYLEFGADDLAGGWKDVPAYVAGADLAAVPGLPEVALGVERSDYATSCCGNPPWYRHVFMRGSWSDHRGRLFAHPLGGNGREWLGHLRIDVPQRGVSARVAGFDRVRRSENLFSPERQGDSRGVNATLEYLGRAGFGGRADLTYERGDAWNMARAAFILSYSFIGIR